MHRFGRSAQQKMKDRWGGGFILATILALAGAWFLGGVIADKFNPGGVAQTNSAGLDASLLGGTHMAMEPHEFNLYFIQVGAFRSEAGANRLARELGDQNLTAMVASKTAMDLHPVMVGPFTSMDGAEAVKDSLAADYNGAFSVSMAVARTSDAIPATAMATKGADMKKGLDALNTYLFEAAAWMEDRATDPMASASMAVTIGKQLEQYASAMQSVDDPQVQQFVAMATAAHANASKIETAAASLSPGSDYQVALNGYMDLLEQYRSFQASK